MHSSMYPCTNAHKQHLAHDVGEDGSRGPNESSHHSHQVVVQHETFCTQSPACNGGGGGGDGGGGDDGGDDDDDDGGECGGGDDDGGG